MLAEKIKDEIRTAHIDQLPEADLLGIIAVGSINTERFSPTSDVDYIVVVRSLNSATLQAAARTRSHLELRNNMPMSNTLVSGSDVRHFEISPQHLDGKAAQALIEGYNRPNYWCHRQNDFTYSLPSASAIRDYARQNCSTLEALATKTLARSENDDESFRKTAKLGRIILKMLAQSNDPSCCAQPGEDWQHALTGHQARVMKCIESFRHRPVGNEERQAFIDQLYELFDPVSLTSH